MPDNHKPGMLNFTASIEPSRFLMFATKHLDGDNSEPLTIERMTVRGTMGNDMKQEDENKAANPNIQRVDVCHLPAGYDTLVVSGTVKFLPNSLRPNSINESKIKAKQISFAQAHAGFITGYKEIGGYRTLAERYLMNLLNGRSLWRNGAEALDFRCSLSAPGLDKLTVKRSDITPENRLALNGIKDESLRELAGRYAEAITQALSEQESLPLLLDVEMRALMGEGQPVYPSQKFIESVRSSNEDGKVLAKTKVRYGGDVIEQAYMHPQKIGNAIRTIDTWFAQSPRFPIAVEPWGVNQAEQKAYRLNNGLYKYLGKLGDFAGKDDPVTHYLAACFIRGGVFSSAKEK